MTAASNSEARKRAAEAASNSESAALASNSTNRGDDTSETANGPQNATQRPAPVDSGAIGRLNEAERARLIDAGLGRKFRMNALQMRTVEEIVREHTDRALAEVEQRIRDTFADPERRRPQIGKFGTDLANDVEWCLLIVRAARKEQGR